MSRRVAARAALLDEVPGALIIDEIKVDSPGPSEVLVRTAAAGVCHSELHFMDGAWTTPLPAVLGHEASGTVIAVGDHVEYVAVGDSVVGCLTPFCGQCEYCLSGRLALCRSAMFARPTGAPARLEWQGRPVNQFVNLSAFAERMLVHEHALVKIDPEVALDRAALTGCAVITGIGAVLNTARMPAGSTVAVVGCGGIGLNAIQGARLAAARTVVAVDVSPVKLELARHFGATAVIDASREAAVTAVRAITGDGVDFAFEAVGAKSTSEQCWRMLRRGGTAVIVGMLAQGVTVELLGTDFIDEKSMTGSNMGSNRFRTDIPRYLELWQQGRIDLDTLISDRIHLDDVNAAYASLREGTVTRQVVLFD